MHLLQKIRQLFMSIREIKQTHGKISYGYFIGSYKENLNTFLERYPEGDPYSILSNIAVLEFLQQMESKLYQHIWLRNSAQNAPEEADRLMVESVIKEFNDLLTPSAGSELCSLFKMQEGQYLFLLRQCKKNNLPVLYSRTVMWTFFLVYEARLAFTPKN